VHHRGADIGILANGMILPNIQHFYQLHQGVPIAVGLTRSGRNRNKNETRDRVLTALNHEPDRCPLQVSLPGVCPPAGDDPWLKDLRGHNPWRRNLYELSACWRGSAAHFGGQPTRYCRKAYTNEWGWAGSRSHGTPFGEAATPGNLPSTGGGSGDRDLPALQTRNARATAMRSERLTLSKEY
jgi:hypothetical protein